MQAHQWIHWEIYYILTVDESERIMDQELLLHVGRNPTRLNREKGANDNCPLFAYQQPLQAHSSLLAITVVRLFVPVIARCDFDCTIVAPFRKIP